MKLLRQFDFLTEIHPMFSRSPKNLVRPRVRELRPYVYGEQPKIKGLIKLNTNENPYPPSPRVLAAVKAAVDGRLRLYPNPTAQAVREKLAKLHRCAPENLIGANGQIGRRDFLPVCWRRSRRRWTGGCGCSPTRRRRRCAKSWRSCTAAPRRTSSSATARMNCWRWRCGRLWSRARG